MSLPKVIVGMSGGVDSSVTAALLKEQGYAVIGAFLDLWKDREIEAGGVEDASAAAQAAADHLGIPLYTLDLKQEFRNVVVDFFIKGYMAGATPSPCVFCNRWFKWNYILEFGKKLDADFIATGHYARIQRSEAGLFELLKGSDALKDQSYMLSNLNQDLLSKTLFPLGGLSKVEVREIAKRFEIPVAERKDSQDLCFLPDGDYRDFLQRNVQEPILPGEIVNADGEVLGEHQGLPFYTIGQRKGIRLSAPEPYYVIDRDQKRNRLIVGQKSDLGRTELTARSVNWISGAAPKQSFQADVKIRYRSKFFSGWVGSISEDSFHVQFAQPLQDITPGQVAVIYDGAKVLGGGIIQ